MPFAHRKFFSGWLEEWLSKTGTMVNVLKSLLFLKLSQTSIDVKQEKKGKYRSFYKSVVFSSIVSAGEFCETEIDECASDPCQNDSPCVNVVNSYTCECATGYAGSCSIVKINKKEN